MVEQIEILRRRDMRDVFTFTIDPADAKDFDDAISFAHNDDGSYQIGVHIADVSFYVRPGTKIDEQAYKRGTSVYLVDRVIPMLPKELCNDKCSLRPNEDKLCMSVVFTMDSDARVLKYKICRTVIRSNARLNYDEAQEIIESSTSRDLDISTALTTLNEMAQKLRAERIANGALTIEQEEMRFRLDSKGRPTEIYFEQPNEAHHLIEEFMLLANRMVAKAVGSGRPFVYRVHDLPDADKLAEVETFKKQFSSRRTSRFAGKSTEGFRRAIEMLTIRAQAKAVYSTYNIGHYGLAFSHYTHFTSPIRRYPDLMVHRLVEKYILTGKKETMPREEMELMCEHCSACEQEAAQAERDSVKMYQAMWMTDHIGEVLTGYISGITDFGLFVQLDESRCEGLIHISKIGDIKRYTLGDAVTVKVVKVDENRAQIDFEFA
jgi:ribonuclease R